MTNKKIKLLEFKEIEDMFTLKDFLLVDEKFNINANKLPSEIIGSRKIIFSKEFFEKVDNKKITKSKLDKQTIMNFEDVFNFIEKSFES